MKQSESAEVEVIKVRVKSKVTIFIFAGYSLGVHFVWSGGSSL